MRLHRFYIKEKIGDKEKIIVQDERIVHQWRNVFRMVVGEKVVLFDGSGSDYISEITSLGKNEAEVSITERKKGIIPDREVWLFFSLIKKDNVELVLQKCTEVGAAHFVPMISERSEKKGLNVERAEKILIEASEQCGRSDVPELREITSLSDAVKKYKDELKLVAFDYSGLSYFPKPVHHPLGLFVGPEGGFTENEIALFKENKIPVYSLGSLTLRAETAAITASALSLI
ncbi:MAG: RsmE family RNA methyltransferase [Candidatus Paceibacterota bacterium]|jgi:16S rRNA (uracil1498-N3)-methyltransferase